ncbi:hypothetical protein B0H14DRAFT_2571732 [Mycena olivaceomarginata]|nr:hypothetical protein B0H14DRAFT_2571732 [Mycena olivaceomarginata]
MAQRHQYGAEYEDTEVGNYIPAVRELTPFTCNDQSPLLKTRALWKAKELHLSTTKALSYTAGGKGTVDLILVLEQLFKITLQFKLMGTVSWDERRDAFQGYNDSASQHGIHADVLALVEKREQLGSDAFGVRRGVEELVKKYSETM